MRVPGLAEEMQEDGRARPRRVPPSGFLRSAVQALDRRLRRQQGIFEFTTGPDCVLRIAIRPSDCAAALADGTPIRTGEPIIDLHLWNENLPRMEGGGADLAWSASMRRRMLDSFVQFAAWLEAHPGHPAVAIRARTPFVSHDSGFAMQRIAVGYGFEPMPRERGGPLRQLHDLGENILIWALVWAYNPAGLRAKRFLRRRHDFWISRRRFLDRYGDTAPAGPRGRDG